MHDDYKYDEYDMIYLYEHNDDNEQNKLFHCYYVSYLLVFNFLINHKKNIVKCYLNYAINEQIRFYPQYMIDLLPKLFKKPKYVNSELSKYYTDYICKLYDRNYRNSWSVDLYDPFFERKYKEFTGHDHVDINYDRERTIFVKQDNKYQYKSEILLNRNECDINTKLIECKYIKFLIQILHSTKINKSSNIIDTKNYGEMSTSYDHLVRCHQLFNPTQLNKIQNYFTSKLGGFCQDGDKCNNIKQHILAKRDKI